MLVALWIIAGCSEPAGQEQADSGTDSQRRDGGDDVSLLDASGVDGDGATDAMAAAADAAPPDHILSVTTTIGGSVNVLIEMVVIGSCPANQTCDFPLSEGSLAFLLPVNETLSFCIWSGDCVGQSACLLAMDGPKAVTANFQSGDQDCP